MPLAIKLVSVFVEQNLGKPAIAIWNVAPTVHFDVALDLVNVKIFSHELADFQLLVSVSESTVV